MHAFASAGFAAVTLSDGVGIAVGIVSVVVGVLAIWLSLKFYQAGVAAQTKSEQFLVTLNEVSLEVRERSRAMGGDLTLLRSEAFALLSRGFDELLGQRSHPSDTLATAGLEQELASQLEAQFETLRGELLRRLQETGATQGGTLPGVEGVVTQAVRDSIGSVLETQRASVADAIRSRLTESGGSMVVGGLLGALMTDHPMSLIVQEIHHLTDAGTVRLDSDRLHADAVASLVQPVR